MTCKFQKNIIRALKYEELPGLLGRVDFLTFDELYFFSHLSNNEKKFTPRSDYVYIFTLKHLSSTHMCHQFTCVQCLLRAPCCTRSLECRTNSYCESYKFLRLMLNVILGSENVLTCMVIIIKYVLFTNTRSETWTAHTGVVPHGDINERVILCSGIRNHTNLVTSV